MFRRSHSAWPAERRLEPRSIPTTGVITWLTGEGTGPSTNVIGVIVSDSGAPALSDTGFVTVVVKEVNQAPAMAPLDTMTVNEGSLLEFTMTATDPDLPANALAWSLETPVPSGILFDSNLGTFRWMPTPLQGPSTNRLQFVVTDNGVPPLSATQSVTIIVRDTQGDFVIQPGSTNLFAGETNAIPLTLAAGVDLTSVSFQLASDATRLTDLALSDLAPAVGNASLISAGSNAVALAFDALPGQTLVANAPLASLGFRAWPNATSGFVYLTPSALLGLRTSGAALTNGLGHIGRLTVIGNEPLLKNLRGTSRTLIVWGIPGIYTIEWSTRADGGWQTLGQVTITDNAASLPLTDDGPTLFYRAYRVSSP